MKVTVTLELRFDIMPDGSVWTLTNFNQSFWKRYLEVYDQVEIVARANPISLIDPKATRVDHAPSITFKPLPFYIGPLGYLKKWFEIRSELKKIERDAEAIVMRVGSPLAVILHPMLMKHKHPYALEVVGDPFDAYAPKAIKSTFRPFYRWWFCHKLRLLSGLASGVSYVTSIKLPERYPAPKGAMVIYASSIELFESHMTPAPKTYGPKRHFNLISVGTLEHWGKGPDTAFEALKILKDKNFSVSLTWLGDGRSRQITEDLAKSMGLSDSVIFKGHLPHGEAVLKTMDEADIFILPTRAEGLPRAMIEAMARGLVCVGSEVGGIPELITQEYFHQVDDFKKLANILERLMKNPQEMNSQSEKNWQKARQYLAPVLQERRRSFYLKLKGITQEWQKNYPRR